MPRKITLHVLSFFAFCLSGSVPISAAETIIPVSLVCSEVVTQVPSLYFSDASYQNFGVELSGDVPGDVFTGQLVVTSSMAEGYGTFVIEADSLLDRADRL